MRSRAALGVLIAVIAVVAIVVPGFALGQSTAGAGQTQPTPATSTATNTTIAIHLRPDGDARFRVSTTFVLNDANDSAAFRALGREFEDGTTGLSVSTFRRAANESSVITGRSMNVTNVTRNATIVGENTSHTDTGRLVLGFTWTNFTRTSGGRIAVGDAFNTTHGTWLPGLTANQTLIIESPPGYTVTRSPVGITNGTLRWEGPASFEPGSPAVVFERRGSGDRSPNRDGDGGPGPLEATPLLAVGAGVVIIGTGFAVFGAYVLTQRGETGERAGGSGGTETSSSVERPGDTPQTAMSDAPAAEELLSDEERVERLLERNDGRMKQAAIVDATGWSNAKVSQLLSTMDEDGRINKLRIGRENLISLPDE